MESHLGLATWQIFACHVTQPAGSCWSGELVWIPRKIQPGLSYLSDLFFLEGVVSHSQSWLIGLFGIIRVQAGLQSGPSKDSSDSGRMDLEWPGPGFKLVFRLFWHILLCFISNTIFVFQHKAIAMSRVVGEASSGARSDATSADQEPPAGSQARAKRPVIAVIPFLWQSFSFPLPYVSSVPQNHQKRFL